MVSARLVMSPGGPSIDAAEKSGWLNSGTSFRLITPSRSTVGVKVSCTAAAPQAVRRSGTTPGNLLNL